jgi:chromosome segregation ATPase
MNEKSNPKVIQTDSKIRELEEKLKTQEKTNKKLKEKLENNSNMLNDVIRENKQLKKRIQEYDLKLVDTKLSQYQKLQEEYQKKAHRLQVTKKHLDNANLKNQDLQEKEKILHQIIADLEKRGLLDYIRGRYPESYQKYKQY